MIQGILIVLFILAVVLFWVQVPFRLYQQIKLGNPYAKFCAYIFLGGIIFVTLLKALVK